MAILSLPLEIQKVTMENNFVEHQICYSQHDFRFAKNHDNRSRRCAVI